MAVGLAFAVLGGNPDPDRVKLALAGQSAEHEYVGTLCGIMDQYVCALGRAGHALLIDCRSLEPQFVPLDLKHAEIVVCDTRVKHELASSEYNRRREECSQAVELLGRSLVGIRSLRDVSVADFHRTETVLPDVIRSRCRHVVTENERTLEAAKALSRGDLARFGKLMLESHASLRYDYEVSCAELDAVVDKATGMPGVFGARMTGGGFGGCVIALVESSKVTLVAEVLKRDFFDKFGKELSVFSTVACAGACAGCR
jgi:galactokinase